MATKGSKTLEITGFVRGGADAGAGAWVFATVLDLEWDRDQPSYTSVPLPLLCGTQAGPDGAFVLQVPESFVTWALSLDHDAHLAVHALDSGGATGATFAAVRANEPIEPVIIQLGHFGAVPPRPPILVEFPTEVLDALVGAGGGGGGSSASSSAAPAILDDRFFEERLRRMVGANVRSGDIAGLRREIDRVVVEEVVEGETQFVFRGPGSARPGRTGATSGSAVRNGRPPGYATANGGGGYGMSSNGDSLAGGQAILYRRTKAEIDYVWDALASLQPVDPLKSAQFEAVRGLVGDGLTDLLEAFGSALRPPVARVNGVFQDLLGADENESTKAPCSCKDQGGQTVQRSQEGQNGPLPLLGFIGDLGQQAGILDENGCPIDGFTQTVADDQAVTRFNELASFLISLRLQWNGFRSEFTAAFTAPTLTSLGAILSSRLGLVTESTRELELAIETAPGDSGERYFTQIGETGTTLDEFLSWQKGYIDDSREQLRDTSRIGLRGIGNEAARLAAVAAAGLGAGANDDTIIGRRLVQRALAELRTNLEGIAEAVRNGDR